MTELLLHSMAELAEIVLPSLEIAGARDVVEIGSEYGKMTEALLAYTAAAGGTLVSVDPAPSAPAASLFDAHAHARLVSARSMEALPALDADAYLVDGDHNWHTVFHECGMMWANSRRSRRPFLALFHDAGWPWGRRDLYYDPSTIPPGYLQPHTWKHGVTLDVPGVVDGGFRGEGQWACAVREGGPRNGVLTAIEDFVEGKEGNLVWAMVPVVFGLGILFDRAAPWSDALSEFLSPYHAHPLLERLERNRLECYLRVIEWQDRQRAQAA